MNDTRTTVVVCDDWPVVAVSDALTARSTVDVRAGRRPVNVTAVVHTNRVVACSPEARRAGVEVGLRRREAQRRCPELMVVERDLRLEARRFEVVAAALDALTPRVEVEAPGWCSFATRGPSRYFGGDASMSLRLVELVDRALEGATTVRVGTADTRFAALAAAQVAGPGEARVVAPSASAAFLAPLPVSALLQAEALEHPDRVAGGTGRGGARRGSPLADLVQVLCRLGLTSLGDFAELSTADVVGRFGAIGRKAHQWASGSEERLALWRSPPDDLDVMMDLDPPVERVDQAAFIAKALADEFCAALDGRGLTCMRVGIGARTEQGEELFRLWRGEEALHAGAVADRMRWQLDGWLTGLRVPRAGGDGGGGLVRLWLQPDQVIAATGRQQGFWGERTEQTNRALRAVARVQGLLGEGSVVVPERTGGRKVGDQVASLGAEAVDLGARASSDPSLGPRSEGSASEAFGARAGIRGVESVPWMGRIPAPFPSVVYEHCRPAEVLDGAEKPVHVSARGILSAHPGFVRVGAGALQPLRNWAGPWLFDERWWDPAGHTRRAYLQVVVSERPPLLLFCANGLWMCEAVYS